MGNILATPDPCRLRLQFTASARSGWRALLRAESLIRRAPVRVLLPAYIGQSKSEGSGVFDPIRKTKAEYEFYPLSKTLTPSLEQIRQQLSTKAFDILLVVHYFGFVNHEMRLVSELCKEFDVLLVEDCAHVAPFIDTSAGKFGDYSFFSLHKFFNVDSGGLLQCNGEAPAPDLTKDETCSKHVLESIQKCDLRLCYSNRRDQFQFLSDRLGLLPQLETPWELNEETVPHNFPMLIGNQLREELYFHLQSRNLNTCALYYQLVPELPSHQFPESFAISRDILNLPISQTYSRDELLILVEEIEGFFEN